MAKLTDTINSYVECRERLLTLRREHSAIRDRLRKLEALAQGNRDVVSARMQQMLALLDSEPTVFVDYDPSLHTLTAQIFSEYVQLQCEIDALHGQEAGVFTEVVKLRRTYRKLVDEIPPLIHSDMAGILSNEALDETDEPALDPARQQEAVAAQEA